MVAPAVRNEAGYAGRAVVVNVSGGSSRKGGGEGGINQIKNKQCTAAQRDLKTLKTPITARGRERLSEKDDTDV